MVFFIKCYQTSVGKKQIVAVTGLLLIGFVIVHLAGNLLIFLGPDVFNAYAKKLANLRPGLLIFEATLIIVFLIHIYTTFLLVLENIKARPIPYTIKKPEGDHPFAARIMSLTGVIVFAFVVWHLLDFTFIDKDGPKSILSDGKNYGLYGVVYNAFSNPFHSLFYIIAMIAVGLHLSHGVQSFMQTFGFNHPVYTPLIRKFSLIFAAIITVGYSSIPIYILINALNH